MTTTKNQPIDTIRDGALKATIWENTGPKGVFYSVELSRTYKDEHDQYQDRKSFSGADLLRVAHLAAKAYDRISTLRQSRNGPEEEAA